ncbi:MAG TPA: hypothetical protein PKJ41_14560 [Bryobacteraceae bacterium]|nr:hypothetical protein [Bryobacteraceae bacterium]HPT27422.1 hypothetical protein [Bryobacteraceae bacterium]
MTPERELEELIYDHLAEENPEAISELDDALVQSRIRLGIRRARKHGLDTDGAAVAFVTLMFLVAPDFDRHPAIKVALSNASLPADERIRAIFSATSEDDWAAAAESNSGWDAERE